MTDRTWTISDIDGKNPRQVTLQQYMAEVQAAAERAKAIHQRDIETVRKQRAI